MLQVELCQECIDWAKDEKRTFLRQALEVNDPSVLTSELILILFILIFCRHVWSPCTMTLRTSRMPFNLVLLCSESWRNSMTKRSWLKFSCLRARPTTSLATCPKPEPLWPQLAQLVTPSTAPQNCRRLLICNLEFYMRRMRKISRRPFPISTKLLRDAIQLTAPRQCKRSSTCSWARLC